MDTRQGGSANEVRVSSWNELNDCLYEGAWQGDIGRFRMACSFRGTCSASYDLTTGLKRLGGSSRELERVILRAFRRYAPMEDVREDSVWNWLALAQHHGLPTRLLDWTYSPYVAMHFATDDPAQLDVDGVIWRVDLVQINELLPERLKGALVEEGSSVFTTEMLSRDAPRLEDFDSLAEEPFVAFFEPPSLDERIVNQYALFSVISDAERDLDEWLKTHPDCYNRIVVPSELKWEVRDKLDQANITERVLYPGLDGLSRWLKRYYTPRSDYERRQKTSRHTV